MVYNIGIINFEEVKHNEIFDHEKMCIGMRGEGDTTLANPDGTPFTLQQNVDLLKKAITDQKKILTENGMGDDPQMFAIYTEVQQYWYGYDADGTLASLKLTNATVCAGAENVRINIDASEGDTVFVWDSAMKAFMNKTEL